MKVRLMKSYHNHKQKQKLEHTMIKEHFILKRNHKITKKYYQKPHGRHSNQILESYSILNLNLRNTYSLSYLVKVLPIYWMRIILEILLKTRLKTSEKVIL